MAAPAIRCATARRRPEPRPDGPVPRPELQSAAPLSDSFQIAGVPLFVTPALPPSFNSLIIKAFRTAMRRYADCSIGRRASSKGWLSPGWPGPPHGASLVRHSSAGPGTSTQQNPTATFSTPGAVTLEASVATGLCTTITKTVVVLDPLPHIVSLGAVAAWSRPAALGPDHGAPRARPPVDDLGAHGHPDADRQSGGLESPAPGIGVLRSRCGSRIRTAPRPRRRSPSTSGA